MWQNIAVSGLYQANRVGISSFRYGQETFMARDERGSEVYLGASLVGVIIRPASGHSLTTLRLVLSQYHGQN